MNDLGFFLMGIICGLAMASIMLEYMVQKIEEDEREEAEWRARNNQDEISRR